MKYQFHFSNKNCVECSFFFCRVNTIKNDYLLFTFNKSKKAEATKLNI